MAHPHYNHNNHNEAGNVPNRVNDRSQNTLLRILEIYLKHRGRDVKSLLTGPFQGYCLGITTLWLYSKWLSFQKPSGESRDDYTWFKKAIDEILKLNEKEDERNTEKIRALKKEIQRIDTEMENNPQKIKELAERKKAAEKELEKEEKEKSIPAFERFFTHIQFFQNSQFYFPKLEGINLDLILEDTKNRKLRNVYSIAGPFNLYQLARLLMYDNVIQNDTLIIVCSCLHVTGLFKHNIKWHYFDSNAPRGAKKIISKNGQPGDAALEVALNIFNAHCGMYGEEILDPYTDPNILKKLPVGFSMFSFDTKSKTPYPDQATVLDNIFNNALDEKAVTPAGETTVSLSVSVKSPPCVIYHLNHGADPNGEVFAGMPVFAAALVSENNGIISAFLQNKALTENTIKLSVELYVEYLGIEGEEEQKKAIQETIFRLKEIKKQYLLEHIPLKPPPPLLPKPQKILNHHRS